ncbi:DNA-3-methyladenine glycosylase family protein [Nakamurella sp.]|uniref:DNA-3-methyladenine glycosylase family protein n=1 Tax=Nakamurella sp. TaxID=1869182 RepID=UPI0037846106
MTSFTITPTTTYSLRESAEFGFGGRAPDAFDGVMRMAFCLDGDTDQVGVELRQDDTGVVHGRVHGGSADRVDAVRAQVARVLSLDQDGTGFGDVGIRDPLIGRLQQAVPGLLPPLFYSPYEAAIWSVLSARRPAKQMAQVRTQLSERHGRVFELAGRRVAALPTPEQLLRVTEFPGLTDEKIHRMHGIARKALTGTLDVDRLRHIGPEACDEDMRRLKGIGPFYASLITIRAVGFTDVLPADEPMLLELVGLHYRVDGPVTRAQFEEIAEPWRPYRTWASVLIRAASSRIGVVGAGRRGG